MQKIKRKKVFLERKEGNVHLACAAADWDKDEQILVDDMGGDEKGRTVA